MADSSKVKEITARLEQGVKDLWNSDTYADYLRTMSRFHKYSTRNTLLIHMQKPNATLVAGFSSWINKFGRHVNKGEKSIQILAPIPITKREEKEKLDPETRKPIIGEDGMPVIEVTEQRFIAKFEVVNVFDVSQTSGKPLPSLVQDLTGNVEQYEAFIDALRAVSPLPIVFEPMSEGQDGYCRFGDKIAIREGMSETQTVCAIIHEITHAKLHDIEAIRLMDENAVPKDRRTEEVEAESVSFSVCSYFGIETGANSFGYLANWSQGRELKELHASLDTIRKTAAEIIDTVDDKFQEIVKDRNITFAIGEQQTELAEPTQTLANENTAVPETDASVDRPTAGAIYARYCNSISDAVMLDEAYGNAVLNADEQNARTECESAIKRTVLRLYSESAADHIELYKQYTENPDFKGRLEDYVFIKTYLEPQTAQRNAVNESTPPNIDVSAIMAAYSRNAEVSNPQRVGAVVLMTPLFDDGNFNRNGKKIRVTVEEPAGKYQLFSRDEGGDKMFYFLTASGRIDNTVGYFRSEWDAKQQKRVYPKPTESELDELLPMIAERFERDMADPTKWVLYQHAAVLNRLDECEAHNAPVKELRNAESNRRREEAEQEREAEQQRKIEKYDTRIDEIAKAIEKGEIINVSYNEYEFDGKNPVLDLFKLYGIALPLRTQGWVNTGLAELSESGYRYYSGKHKGNSTAFSGYFNKLRQAIKEMPIEQKRENPTNPEIAVKEAIKTVENNLYEKFAEMFPQIENGEYRNLRLESDGFEPLSVEWIGENRISIMHTYKMNGDLMYDPMISFEVDRETRTMNAVEFEQSMPPLYQRVEEKNGDGQSIDGNGNERTIHGLQKQINDFTGTWFDNINEQNYLPVRATAEIDGEDIHITFDKDGNPILPETPKTVEKTVEHNLYNKFSEMFPQFMNGEYSHLRLEAEHAKPLELEWVFGDRISMAHTYELNGKHAYEPMIMFTVNSSDKTMTACSFELSEPPRNDVVYDDKGRADVDMQKNINNLAVGWLNRAEKQGFRAVSATVELDSNGNISKEGLITDKTVQITFDKDGTPIMPIPEQADNNSIVPSNDVLAERIERRLLESYISTGASAVDGVPGAFINPDQELAIMRLNRFRESDVARDLFIENERKNYTKTTPDNGAPKKESVDGFTLGYGEEDNGVAVWNWNDLQDGGAYKYLAHISQNRAITYLVDNLPVGVKADIKIIANGDWDKMFEIERKMGKYYEDITDKSTDKITGLDISLPDPSIGFSEMNLYGYAGDDMFPLTNGRAVELFDTDHCIYLLYPDNTEAMVLDRDEILNHDGLCGIESVDWERSPVRAAQMAVAANAEGKLESEFLYGDDNKFGIYQIRDGIDEARNFRFAPMRELEALGLTVDRANYELVYTAPFSERIEFLSDRYPVLNKIYEDFNINQPTDFTGHSLSVSDVVVLKYNGDLSTHFVDSVGFVEIDNYVFFGEERINTQTADKLETLSQVGTRSEEYTGVSVAEFEADAKVGKVISLYDFSKAINAENGNKSRPPAPKGKPTLMERLEEGKRKAAQNGQPDAPKNKEREV